MIFQNGKKKILRFQYKQNTVLDNSGYVVWGKYFVFICSGLLIIIKRFTFMNILWDNAKVLQDIGQFFIVHDCPTLRTLGQFCLYLPNGSQVPPPHPMLAKKSASADLHLHGISPLKNFCANRKRSSAMSDVWLLFLLLKRAYLDVDITLSSKTFHNCVNAAMVHINRALKLIIRLFLVEDLVDSLKVSCLCSFWWWGWGRPGTEL